MIPTVLTSEKIAGTVILYNSTLETLDNIKTYIDQVERLYVVDNSNEVNNELVEALRLYSNLHYHSLNGNKGIASALNWAAQRAIQDGFEVLLTMDDDTRTPDGMVCQMTDFWNQYPLPLGILSGVHHNKPATVPYKTLLYTLTSGNFLNLKAYQHIGGFEDNFFIDHVDHEYCIRLNAKGYQVVELPAIHLEHKLGYSQEVKLGGWRLRRYGTNSPIRLYYYARNGLYVARTHFAEHPHFAWMFTKEITRRWLKTLFLDADRPIRIKMLVQGLRDGWHGRLGRYVSPDEQ